MAYTRPTASAADATFLGAPAYTRPAAGTADATWAAASSQTCGATGWVQTAFGAPSLSPAHAAQWPVSTAFGDPFAIFDQTVESAGASWTAFGSPSNRRTQPAEGSSAAQFGTPSGANWQRAEGFYAPAFGTARLFPSHVGVSTPATAFGTATGLQANRVSAGWPISKFGTPTTPTNRTEAAEGFLVTRTGRAIALKYAPVILARTVSAFGYRRTAFGTPSAFKSQTGTASGLAPVAWGTPTAHRKQEASGAIRTECGSSTVRITQRTAGFKPGSIGAPTATVRVSVETTGSFATRAGRPTARVVLREAGASATQVGGPSAVARITAMADGARSSTFGVHRVSAVAIASVTYAPIFGTPAACITQRATGARNTLFSPAVVRMIVGAASTFRAPSFGAPGSERSNTYTAYGIDCSRRLGQPQGYSRFNYRATGSSATATGAPSCVQRHLARHTSPGTSFGNPLLKRITQC